MSGGNFVVCYGCYCAHWATPAVFCWYARGWLVNGWSSSCAHRCAYCRVRSKIAQLLSVQFNARVGPDINKLIATFLYDT